MRPHLVPGEVRGASFTFAPETLSMLDQNPAPVVEPGDSRIMIGSLSKNIRLKGILTDGR